MNVLSMMQFTVHDFALNRGRKEIYNNADSIAQFSYTNERKFGYIL